MPDWGYVADFARDALLNAMQRPKLPQRVSSLDEGGPGLAAIARERGIAGGGGASVLGALGGRSAGASGAGAAGGGAAGGSIERKIIWSPDRAQWRYDGDPIWHPAGEIPRR